MTKSRESPNFDTFRDCLSEPVIRKLAPKPTKPVPKRKSGKKVPKEQSIASTPVAEAADAQDLGDFIEYLASEIFASLPAELRDLSYSAIQNDAGLSDKYGDPLPNTTVDALLAPLPLSVSDSLSAYGLVEDTTSLPNVMIPVLQAYVNAVTAPPPVWQTTRASACEICERDWIPLTYHHLIPRSTHAKVLKRGWHEEWMLHSVAWLCRACHSFVHSIESNEELAKNWFTVEKLQSREDVQKWAAWVGRVRWKSR